MRNGYTYEIDARGRTRRVSGLLSDTDTPARSSTTQAKAGGEDRRISDDGGHYIAARFDGPTDAFNHFAQDANFNRGRYRVLEDEWAKAKRAGKEVTATIVPHCREGALRPFEIDVSFTVNGQKRSIKMPNERTEKRRGKR
ncbi:DNA/RNA non-specific endonuclease [Sphingomonas sp. M1-B02]|uniref:DNA/RNA non-specific endonuclease n=1 Tax=Sphingomonas sp. M1-B02 TaxID=3114300 RepID=UPI00223F8713|nr:DNA/RNA non-specific endonuclease [Sphingomonas sp. S6-11]UZK65350.1 DNA/RNA non-specific endonuclease [Sphingomonas sp. S6-11]